MIIEIPKELKDKMQEIEVEKQKLIAKLEPIDGTDLIKVIEDSPEIPTGKIDVLTQQGIFPMNYDPKTGEVREWK